MPNEADTCRRYVVPKLQAAGWENEPHRINEQVTFTDGRIVVTGRQGRRRPGKRADYILRFRPDFPIAVVEAKPTYNTPGDGLQQAKDYAEILDLKFAYATNGHGIIEFDYLTGLEREIDTFPTPDELWRRLTGREQLAPEVADRLLTPTYNLSGKHPRYYQEIAINRTVRAILLGNRRVSADHGHRHRQDLRGVPNLLEALVSRWNRTGEHRRPKILYLADRNVLVDDPKDKTFTPFGDARIKIGEGELSYGREMYFAIYQAIAKDERRPGLYKEFPRDFFDLIVVDECHRGSARPPVQQPDFKASALAIEIDPEWIMPLPPVAAPTLSQADVIIDLGYGIKDRSGYRTGAGAEEKTGVPGTRADVRRHAQGDAGPEAPAARSADRPDRRAREPQAHHRARHLRRAAAHRLHRHAR